VTEKKEEKMASEASNERASLGEGRPIGLTGNRAEAARVFPIQPAVRGYPRAAAPLSVPWSVAERAYGVYASRYGTSQSLERLAERSGFAVEEMDDFYPPWREEVSEIAALRAERDRLREALGVAIGEIEADTDAVRTCSLRPFEAEANRKLLLDRLRAALAPDTAKEGT
jgi:hypothetical protein